MNLTPENKEIGKQNFQEALGVSRRAFLKTAAVAPALGAFYFGYEKLHGNSLKVGIIGTGDEGGVLISQLPPDYMDVVAIADLRPSNQRRAMHGDGNEHRVGFIKKLGAETAAGIKVYDDHRAMLANKDIEAVIVAVPLNQHCQVTLDCLEAGKHVLCEKLMAQNITDCKRMIKAAAGAHKLLAVGHQRHYSVLYDNANDLVKQGVLGDIKFIRANWHRNNSWPGIDSWNKKIPDEDRSVESRVRDFGYDSVEQLCRWRLFNKTGGGIMAELGSHQLDACSIFLGKRHPIAIQGYGGRNFYGVHGVGSKDKQADPREIDDHVYVTVEFPGPHYAEDKHDIVIVTYSSINTNNFEPYGESIFGSRGTLITELEQSVMLFKEQGGDSGAGGPGQRLRVVSAAQDGKPVLEASASLAPTATAAAAGTTGKVSRGYTEEMEHFAYCVKNEINEPADKGGLRCPGRTAMADAIMALTANLAMKHKKRIVFNEEWFDPDNAAVPETDPAVVG